jgi:hypothetical protein
LRAWSFVCHCQLSEANSFLGTQDKLRNLGFKEINKFEIAAPALNVLGQAQQKTLLAMTFREFLSNLLDVIPACPESSLFNALCGHLIPLGSRHAGAGLEPSGNDDFLRVHNYL